MTGTPTLLDGPIKFVMWVSCFFTVMMMLHVSLDVFLRVTFNAPLIGTFEVVANYYMISVMYLPLAYVSRTEGQIVVELFTRGFSKKTLLVWDAVAHAVTVAYMAAFAFYTGLMAVEMTETGEIMEMGDDFLSVWPARWLLPLGFALMALYMILRARQDYRKSGEVKVPISA